KKSPADRNYLVSEAGNPRFAQSLQRVAKRERVNLFVPTTDLEVRVIGELRDGLPGRAFLPRQAVIELCQDKYELAACLRSRGVPAPLTCALSSLESAEAVFAQLAPRRPLWCRIRTGAASMGATPVATAAQARNWVSYWAEMRGVPPSAFTLSEYLPGRDFACQSLWKDGQLK